MSNGGRRATRPFAHTDIDYAPQTLEIPMVEVIIIIVLLVVGFPLAVVAASRIEPDSPTGAPPSPTAE
jgi:hypothetical protein